MFLGQGNLRLHLSHTHYKILFLQSNPLNMKQFLSLTTLLLLFGLIHFNIYAQDNTSSKKDKPSNIGLFLGLNRGNSATEPQVYSTEGNTGYEFGLFLRTGKWFYVQSGITYMKLSQQLTTGASFPDKVKDNLSISRLELPFYIGLNVLPIGHKIFNIRGFAGPAFSYALSVKDNDLGISTDEINRFQADLGAGVGLDILFMKLDLGFNYGLANLISGEKSHISYGFLTFGLGI